MRAIPRWHARSALLWPVRRQSRKECLRATARAWPVYLATPSLSREDILYAIADELAIEVPTGRANAVLRALQEHLIKLYGKGHQVVVLIDEAHAMPAETLEEIRLLSNLESNHHM